MLERSFVRYIAISKYCARYFPWNVKLVSSTVRSIKSASTCVKQARFRSSFPLFLVKSNFAFNPLTQLTSSYLRFVFYSCTLWYTRCNKLKWNKHNMFTVCTRVFRECRNKKTDLWMARDPTWLTCLTCAYSQTDPRAWRHGHEKHVRKWLDSKVAFGERAIGAIASFYLYRSLDVKQR